MTQTPASQGEHSEASRHQEDGVGKRELTALRRLEGEQVRTVKEMRQTTACSGTHSLFKKKTAHSKNRERENSRKKRQGVSVGLSSFVFLEFQPS